MNNLHAFLIWYLDYTTKFFVCKEKDRKKISPGVVSIVDLHCADRYSRKALPINTLKRFEMINT